MSIEYIDKDISDLNLDSNKVLLLFRNNQEYAPNIDIIDSSIEIPEMYDKVLNIYKKEINKNYHIIEGKYLLCIFRIFRSRDKMELKENFEYLSIEILKRLGKYNNILTYCPFEEDDKKGIEVFNKFIDFLSKYTKITFFKHRGYNININYEEWLVKDAIERNIRKNGDNFIFD